MQNESPASPTDLQHLQKQIQDLTEVYTRFQSLRQIPTVLLRPPVSNGIPFVGQNLRSEFERLKEIGEHIDSAPIQAALLRAYDSLRMDETNIQSNPRRENRKKRRAPSPASPQPYEAKVSNEPLPFPPLDENAIQLTADELPHYVREYNEGNKMKLHVWRRTAEEPRSERPRVMRFTIPDVMTVYIFVGYHGTKGIIVVENMIAFAPRERKAPHLQSEYSVYQELSQQFARVLHSHPNIAFQSLMKLLAAYERLFEDRCLGCGRVLSVEGHAPPVVRLWKGVPDGGFEARHSTCRPNMGTR